VVSPCDLANQQVFLERFAYSDNVRFTEPELFILFRRQCRPRENILFVLVNRSQAQMIGVQTAVVMADLHHDLALWDNPVPERITDSMHKRLLASNSDLPESALCFGAGPDKARTGFTCLRV